MSKQKRASFASLRSGRDSEWAGADPSVFPVLNETGNDESSSETALEAEFKVPILVSPYEQAVLRNLDTKLLSNRVYPNWYRRYAHLIPHDDRYTKGIQPFTDLDRRNREIALQHFYGREYRKYEACRLEEQCRPIVERAIRAYRRFKAREEERPPTFEINEPVSRETSAGPYQSMRDTMGGYSSIRETMGVRETLSPYSKQSMRETLSPYSKSKRDTLSPYLSVRESVTPFMSIEERMQLSARRQKKHAEVLRMSTKDRSKVDSIIKYIKFAQGHKQRKDLQMEKLRPDSSWLKLKDTRRWTLLLTMAKEIRRQAAVLRFVRVFNLVRSVLRFLTAVAQISKDTKVLLKCEFKRLSSDTSHNDFELLALNKEVGRHTFNAKKYKMRRLFHVPSEIMLILTKPWFERGEDEIDQALDFLTKLRSFVTFPEYYQRYLAKTGWIIDVPPHRVIIREGQLPTDYYFLISGRVKLEKLEGDPDVTKRSSFILIKECKDADVFGNENITDKDTYREYTARAECSCQLFCINIDEFYQVLRKGDQDEEPESKTELSGVSEYIRFLSYLPFLQKLPFDKLVEESENDIGFNYFFEGKCLTVDLNKSKFIYVIHYGNCQVLEEKKPPQSAITRYNRKQTMATVSFKDTRRKSDIPSITEMVESMRQFGTFVKPSKPSARSINQESRIIESARKTLNTRTNAWSKTSFDLLADSKKVEMKNKSLSRRLSKTSKLALEFNLGSQMNISEEIELPPIEKSSSSSIEWGAPKRRSVNFTIDEESDEMPPNKEKSVLHVAGSNIDIGKTEFQRKNLKSFTGSSPKIEEQKKSKKKAVKSVERAADKENRMKSKPEETVIVDAIEGPKFEIEMVPRGEPELRKEIVEPFSKIKRSFWTYVRTCSKGDVVGLEFLDLKNGPFNPPKATWSLVSNGATVITIRRSFLLKHLSK